MRISIVLLLAAGLAIALALALTGTDARAQGCCAVRGAPTTCNPC